MYRYLRVEIYCMVFPTMWEVSSWVTVGTRNNGGWSSCYKIEDPLDDIANVLKRLSIELKEIR